MAVFTPRRFAEYDAAIADRDTKDVEIRTIIDNYIIYILNVYYITECL